MESVLTSPEQKPAPYLTREEPDGGASAHAANSPLVSIIVVNHNGMDVLPKCLSALSNLDHPNCEVIIVDNGSKDGSAEFAEAFSSKHPQHVLRFPKNRGLAVARNAGVRLGKGRYFAFIDNDGFAEADWLSAALDAFAANPRIGAIAPLVLFNSRPDIVNGLGGGLTDRAFGFDFLYYRPLGYYPLPDEILYPMGCGMVLRQEVVALIFPIDEMLINYYDDVEIGIRTWKSGYRVEPCANAKVRHAFSHSTPNSSQMQKEVLCHRNRLRTALKYRPLLKLPLFFINEFITLSYEMRHNYGDVCSIFLWNLRHLGSALSIRFRFPPSSNHEPLPISIAKELHPYPKNADFSPNWEKVREVVDMETTDHLAALDFGWYYLENNQQTPFRFTADVASAFLRTTEQTNSFLLRFMPYTDAPFTVELLDNIRRRPLYRWEFAGFADELFKMHSVLKAVALPAGDYQVLFRCEFDGQPPCERVLGVGVNFVGLWNLP
jgi:GT2 family glycosyltransferase